MKIAFIISGWLALTVISTQAQTTSSPQSTPYAIVSRDANSQVWQRTTYETDPSGKAVARVHKYTELATGLNYRKNGKWVASKAEIDILPNGTAEAIQGQHQVYFPGNIYQGEIELVTPDGKDLKSRPLGLSYDDGTNSVLIAELTNSIGYVVGSNQVIYPDAFTDVKADLVCTYRKSGFECDVVFREQPPSPEQFGLSSDSRLQMLTEFFNPPKPTQTIGRANARDGLRDTTLTFGKTTFTHGRAFAFSSAESRTPVARHQMPVYKSWQHLDGRTFLVEELPYRNIEPELEQLPAPANGATTMTAPNSILYKVSTARLLPPSRNILAKSKIARVLTKKPAMIQLAKSDFNQKPGVILDYTTINSGLTNYTFRGDMTYLITGEPELNGTTTIEGGSVLKFDDSDAPYLDIFGPLVCKTAAFRPAIFTSKNDNIVGETISGSTGSPSIQPNSWGLILEDDSAADVSNIRFCYLQGGIAPIWLGTPVDIWDCQFVKCADSVDNYSSAAVYLDNVLFAHCSVVAAMEEGSEPLVAEQITADVTNLYDTNSWMAVPSEVDLTNSVILGAIGTGPTFNTNSVAENPPGNIFQTVGGGSYYLSTNSLCRNAGTTNIDPDLLADIQTKTTYPPIVYSNTTLSVATTFSPQAQRDTDTPDLGYHYDPLDYVFGGCSLYTNLTFSAGTAVGLFETYGSVYASGQPYAISLNDGANLTSIGTATQPCWIAQTMAVQEGGNGNWTDLGWVGEITLNGSGSGVTPQLNGQFTRWPTITTDSPFRDNWAHGNGSMSDCEFYCGDISTYDMQSFNFTNCLFYRVAMYFFDQDTALNFTFQNCTFYNGFIAMCRYSGQPASLWTIRDTTFDGTGFSASDNYNGNTNYTAFDYNAYDTNNLSGLSYSYPYTPPPTNVLEDIGPHDVFAGDYNWQSSWFGDFYLPSDSPLIDAGSTTADQVGLYHFTTQTNSYSVEYNSIVDIGYHYVAIDAYGNPLDSDGDGIPDYLEDANGNGIVDSGETDWQNAADLGLKVIITKPRNGSTLP